jgi:hypothetical protein
LIKSSVFKDVNRPIAIAKCPSMQCFPSWSQQTETQQTRNQAWTVSFLYLHSCPSRMSQTPKSTITIPSLIWKSGWSIKSR